MDRLRANKEDHAANRVSGIGLASLVPQVYRKATKKGFEFTVMAVGLKASPERSSVF